MIKKKLSFLECSLSTATILNLFIMWWSLTLETSVLKLICWLWLFQQLNKVWNSCIHRKCILLYKIILFSEYFSKKTTFLLILICVIYRKNCFILKQQKWVMQKKEIFNLKKLYCCKKESKFKHCFWSKCLNEA